MNETTTTIEFNDEFCTLVTYGRERDYRERSNKTVVHVSNDFDPEDLSTSGFTCRPEPSIKGVDPANDKLWKKYNRFETKMQKMIIQEAIKRGMIPADLADGLVFSRKAGCNCGCSPGWVKRDFKRRDIWIDLKSPTKEQERKEREQEYFSGMEEKTLASMVI